MAVVAVLGRRTDASLSDTTTSNLSLGSIVGVTAYLVGQQLTWHNDIPPLVSVLLAIGIGTIMGTINGVVIAYGRVPSIVTTIGTLAIYRAFLVEYSHAVPITTNGLPRWIVDLPKISLANAGDVELRPLFLIMVVVVLIFQFVLTFLPAGRRLYAIGSNPDAARVAGFPAQRMVFIAFVLSGALAGLAGFMFLVRYGNITVLAGTGLEFQAIAAAVVGGGQQCRRLGHGCWGLPWSIVHRPVDEQPASLGGPQPVLARRHPRHVDPAGRRAGLCGVRAPEKTCGHAPGCRCAPSRMTRPRNRR